MSYALAIKQSLGRLEPGFEPERIVPAALEESDIESLAVTHEHALRVSTLPLHHRDPFDRLLVAQCLVEGLTVVTPDPVFKA